MSATFDYDVFNKRLGTVFAKSNDFTFEDCVRQIEDLRMECETLDDEQVQDFVDREANRMMLRIVIDKCQPFSVVSECFLQNISRGFNSHWSEVYSTLEFADYCLVNNHMTEGIRVLSEVRQGIVSIDNMPEELKHHLLLEIEKCNTRLNKSL